MPKKPIEGWKLLLKPKIELFSTEWADASEVIFKFVNQYWESLEPYIEYLLQQAEERGYERGFSECHDIWDKNTRT